MKKVIKLELLNDKQETVVYKQPLVSARKVREALDIQVSLEELGFTTDVLDSTVAYVASIFDNVTPDMIWDGLMSWELMPELQRVMMEVIGADKNLQQANQ
ncbi:phage tail assembly chaperone G [Vagococcus lutrae]|uniref:phage tail assembly chaperone G n=1 Tax=Vagococcus lutrae TaxID=81947 RepID=UPI00288CEB70|nr:hypothetical protein [Vagococcus lutrae]MDT2808386.1 hypothetical protein [Vagococcus lutrae]